MTERQRNLTVGLTTLIGTLALVWMLILFGYLPDFIQRGYPLTIRMDSARGIGADSQIYCNGVNVGTVLAVELQDPPKAGVSIRAKIDESLKLPVGTRAELTPAIFGSPTLSLVTNGDPDQPDAFLSQDGSAVIEGELVSPFAGMLEGSLERLSGPLENFQRVADNFEQLSESWTRVGDHISLLVEPRDVGDVDRGEAIGNLASVLARADARLTELRNTLEGINRFAQNDQLYDDLTVTVANARELTGKAKDRVDEISDAVQTNIGDLTHRYVALADDLSAAVHSLQSLAEQARKPDGTLGKMLVDPQLYDNLNDAATRLQQTLTEVRLLVQKWKAEGLPVQF